MSKMFWAAAVVLKEILDLGPLATGTERMVLMDKQMQQLKHLCQAQHLSLIK